jgi:hypothetical protein
MGWFTAEATSSHIYICGGWNLSGLTSAVYYAPLDTSGAIGEWTATTPLPVPLYTQGGILIDSCIYVVGGALSISGPVVADVRYARIQPDGALGDWTATSSLPMALRIMGVVAHDTFVYSIGGRGNDGRAKDVTYFARINTDGSLEQWDPTSSLNRAIDGLTCAVMDGWAYAIGGDGLSSDYSAECHYGLSTWADETPLPAIRWASDGLAVNDLVYVPGGYDGNPQASVYLGQYVLGVRERPAGGPTEIGFQLTASVLRRPAELRFSLSGKQPVRLSIVDASGRTRETAVLEPGEHELALPSLEPGTYFARLRIGTGFGCERFEVLE